MKTLLLVAIFASVAGSAWGASRIMLGERGPLIWFIGYLGGMLAATAGGFLVYLDAADEGRHE